MDVTSKCISACALDGSIGAGKIPLIKAKIFYSQKDKPACHNKLQSTRHDKVHPGSNNDLTGSSEKHYVIKKKNNIQLKMKAYSKKKHKELMMQGVKNDKSVRAIPGHEIGKLISDRFTIKSDNKRTNKMCKTPALSSPLAPSELDYMGVHSEKIVLHTLDRAPGDDSRKDDEIVIGDTIGEAIDKLNEDRKPLCYKGSKNVSAESSEYNTFEGDSEDEDFTLGYSSIDSEECTNQKRIESSECLVVNENTSPSRIINSCERLSEEEPNKQNVMDLGSDDDLYDSSLCSIMDKKNSSILGGAECNKTDANEDQNIDDDSSPVLTESIGHEGLEHETISPDENPDNQLTSAVSCETSSYNGCVESVNSLRSKEKNNNSIYQQMGTENSVDKGQLCPGTPQGLFRYFKKASRGNQRKQPIDTRSKNNLYLNLHQNGKGRSSVKPIIIRPKCKSMFNFNQEATIDDLATMPGILPQNQLAPSLMSNVASQIKKRKKSVDSHKNGSKKFEQLYIDVGQKNFGHTTCPVCGMVYTKTLPEDVMQHSKYHHDVMQKLKFKGWKSERTLTEYLDGRIIQVNPDDNSLHLKKVAELREIVDRDLGFAYAVAEYSYVEKVFLFISSKKIVGCAIAVPVKKAYPVIEAQDLPSSEKCNGPALSWCCSSTPVRALCGISRIWVLKQARRQQIASRLVDQVRRHFIYGVEIQKAELAFSDPTPDGRLFAEKYSGTPNFLVFR